MKNSSSWALACLLRLKKRTRLQVYKSSVRNMGTMGYSTACTTDEAAVLNPSPVTWYWQCDARYAEELDESRVWHDTLRNFFFSTYTESQSALIEAKFQSLLSGNEETDPFVIVTITPSPLGGRIESYKIFPDRMIQINERTKLPRQIIRVDRESGTVDALAPGESRIAPRGDPPTPSTWNPRSPRSPRSPAAGENTNFSALQSDLAAGEVLPPDELETHIKRMQSLLGQRRTTTQSAEEIKLLMTLLRRQGVSTEELVHPDVRSLKNERSQRLAKHLEKNRTNRSARFFRKRGETTEEEKISDFHRQDSTSKELGEVNATLARIGQEISSGLQSNMEGAVLPDIQGNNDSASYHLSNLRLVNVVLREEVHVRVLPRKIEIACSSLDVDVASHFQFTQLTFPYVDDSGQASVEIRDADILISIHANEFMRMTVNDVRVEIGSAVLRASKTQSVASWAYNAYLALYRSSIKEGFETSLQEQMHSALTHGILLTFNSITALINQAPEEVEEPKTKNAKMQKRGKSK